MELPLNNRINIMKKNLAYIVYSSIIGLFMFSCAGYEPAKLETNSDRAKYKISSVASIPLGDTVLYDFKGSVGEWWSDSKYTISKIGSAMKVKANGVGPSYEPFGVEFDELDFSQAPFLKVKIKIAEGTTDFPALRIDLKDDKGMQTNGAPASAILDSAGYKIYIYDYFKKFKQTYPDNADVNDKKITGIQAFVNPGGKAWKGTFFIDEIATTSNPDGSGKLPENYVLDDFTGAVDLWWPCKPEKVNVSKLGSDKLKIHINDGQWDCFGKIFGEVDISETPIIRVRARAESETGMQKTNIMARFIDINENATDLIDGKNMRDFEIGGADFKEYYSVFRTDISDDLYSGTGDFDPTKVNRIIIFINMNQEANFTGDIIVDEVAFVKELPAEVNEVINNRWGPVPTPEPSWDKGAEAGLITDFSSISGWKSENNAVKVSQGNGSLKLDASVTGNEWASVVGTVKGSNLYANNYVKLKVKANGSIDPTLRFTFIDDKGLESNARPQEARISKDGQYAEYYLKLFNSSYQRTPSLKIVNMQNVQKIRIYINPGLGAYKGTIEIDEMTSMNVNDVPKDIVSSLKGR